MVAISLYRGNLHRVPDAPRQWVMPRRSISLKQFRSLLRRRSKALSVLTGTDQSAITTTVPLPPPPPPLPPPPRVLPQPSSPSPPAPIPPEKQKQGEGNTNIPSEEAENRCPEDEKLKDPKESGGDDCVAEKLKDSIVLYEGETDADVGKVKGPDAVREHSHGGKLKDSQAERGKQEGENRDGQGNNNVKTGDEKEKRQKEIVEELEVLNKKKHNLVQLLKQILNAEEELKRRSSNHVPPRPSLSLQVDVTKDSGSLTRQPTPRLGSDMNVAEVKGEAEDYSNPVIQPRQSLRLSSTSPSAESALRRAPHFQHQVSVSLPSRSSAFAAGSPSRFAPLASQSSAPPPTMQTVSVSGTSYAASSPSPAASGGTSSFRDTRHPSPWN